MMTNGDMPVEDNDPIVSVIRKLNSVNRKLSARSREYAKKLDKAKTIYVWYTCLDSFNLSYSMIKYILDIQAENGVSSSGDLHDWMTTSSGLAISALTAIGLISFALMADKFDEKDRNRLKRYIVIAWPHCRDAAKGLKNAFKGIRSTVQAAHFLTGKDIGNLVVPVGIVLGVLSMVNRICMRKYVVEPRNLMMIDNNLLLAEIKAQPKPCRLIKMSSDPTSMSLDDLAILLQNQNACIQYGTNFFHFNFDKEKKKLKLTALSAEKSLSLPLLFSDLNDNEPRMVSSSDFELIYRARVCYQDRHLQYFGVIGAAYGGVVDGLYLYMGALSLATLSPYVFAVMVIACTAFSLACIVVRVYEQYSYQRDLASTHAQIELALCGQEVARLFAELHAMSLKHAMQSVDLSKNFEAQQKQLEDELTKKMNEFEQKHEYSYTLGTLTQTAAGLAGLKSGLAAYGVISSLMFTVAAFIALSSGTFPPALMIAGILAGIPCLIGFVIYFLNSNEQVRARQLEKADTHTKLYELLTKVKLQKDALSKLEEVEIKEAFLDDMSLDFEPASVIPIWSEIFRSGSSGLGKGKTVGYIFTRLQKVDAQGHYHDTPIMVFITLASAAAFAVVLFLRALAKGFGKLPLSQPVPPSIATLATDPSTTERAETAVISSLTPVLPNEATQPLAAEAIAERADEGGGELRQSVVEGSDIDKLCPDSPSSARSSSPTPDPTPKPEPTIKPKPTPPSAILLRSSGFFSTGRPRSPSIPRSFSADSLSVTSNLSPTTREPIDVSRPVI